MKISKWIIGLSLLATVAYGAANRVLQTEEILGTQIATPANPVAGKNKLYFKSNGNLYKLSSAGVEEVVGGGAASAVTFTPAGGIAATDVQAAIQELDTEKASATSVSDHLADTTDAHAGTAITNTATGNISATTAQAAINELDTEKQATDTDLTALAGLSSTGIVTRTGSATYSERTITGTADQITVTNGNGVSGNPTLSIPSDPVTPGTDLTFGTSSGINLKSGTAVPTTTATTGNVGSLYFNTTTGDIYRKTDSGSSTNWVLLGASAAITAPVAYTPTISGCGTVSSVNFYYRQIGDYLHIEGSFVSGTPAASSTTFTLPNSGTIGTINSNTLVGSGTRNNAAGGTFSVIATASGASTLGIGTKGANGLAVVNCNSVIASGDVVAVNAVVRVAGLASVVNTATTTIITAPTAYTPTFVGFGTVSNVKITKRQIGNFLEISGTFQAGTTTGSIASMSLPSGLTLDTTNLIANTTSAAGTGLGNYTANGVANADGRIVSAPSTDATLLYFGASTTTSALFPNAGSTIAASSSIISVYAMVPIAGLPGVIPAPDLAGYVRSNSSSNIKDEWANISNSSTRTAACTASPCTINKPSTSGWITTAARSSAGLYALTLAAGYSDIPICTCNGSDTGTAGVRVVHCDASSTTNVNVRVTNSANAADDTAFNIRCVGPR